jgi:ribonuclease PH
VRTDGRRPDELRPIRITPGFQPHAEGSVLIECGLTRVSCAASIEEKVPPHLVGTGKGWVTAEYAMLPRATNTRSGRGPNGRASEIQRLIGRALRSAVRLEGLGPRTITVDCDVIVADGGTRTASITGGFVALVLAIRTLRAAGAIAGDPIVDAVAAVSVGVIDGAALLDLPYSEDSRADVDMNIVMTAAGKFVEVQGTGEAGTFDRKMLDALVDLAAAGVRQLCAEQTRVLQALT